MKKIVVINGSASVKGYTMKMVRIFEEYLTKKNPDVEMEYIHLIKKNLKTCLGCCRCLARGVAGCPLVDDGMEILEKMRQADGIIFAAPGYSHMVSGLYKNFMDRFMYLDHLPDVEFPGKPAVVISTSGAEGINKTPRYMADYGVLWWGCNVTDVIGIASAMFIASEKYEQKTIRRLDKAAKKYIAEMRLEEPRKPSFKQWSFFMFNKTENQPYRMQHWIDQSWMDSDYYYKTFVNPLYKLFGLFIFPSIKLVYRLSMGKTAKEKIARYLEERY